MQLACADSSTRDASADAGQEHREALQQRVQFLQVSGHGSLGTHIACGLHRVAPL